MVQLDVASAAAVGGERRQAAPQPFKFGCVDAGPGTARINQPSIWIVVAEQQRPEPRPGALGSGPADHEGKPNSNNSAAFTNPARCQADSIMD